MNWGIEKQTPQLSTRHEKMTPKEKKWQQNESEEKGKVTKCDPLLGQKRVDTLLSTRGLGVSNWEPWEREKKGQG